MEKYRLSDEYLAQGWSILIFPEDPELRSDERSGMRTFKSGFAHLGTIHLAGKHWCLQFYPVAVLQAWREVWVGHPITFNPLNQPALEREKITRLLESIIRSIVVSDFADRYYEMHLPESI